jgi:F-type H+-transporting ATPase subunit c
MRSSFIKIALFALAMVLGADNAFAEEIDTMGSSSGLLAIGAGLAMGLAALGCGIGQGLGVASGLESIGRNPAASGKLFTPMLIGLVFIEALGIISFVIAFTLSGYIGK